MDRTKTSPNGGGAEARDGAQEPRKPEGGEPAGDAKPKKPANPVRRLIVTAVVGLLVVVALIYGIGALAYAMAHESTDDAKIDADQVAITSRIAERVKTIRFDTNQRVRKGDVLIELDDRNERSQVAAAQASLDSALASARAAAINVAYVRDQQLAQTLQANGQLDQARANIRNAREQTDSSRRQIAVAQSVVAAAQASLRSAQAALPGALENLRRARADLARTTALVATGDVAQTQLDADRATEQQAQSNYVADLAQVENARATLLSDEQKRDAQVFAANGTAALEGVQEGALTSARGEYALNASPFRVPTQKAQAGATSAQAETARAQLRIAQDNLSYTVIRSPIDGYVGEKDAEIGRQVSAGENLLTIIPASGVYVTANFKETQIGKMCLGDAVDVNVDAYPHVPFVGHVASLSPASENSFSLVPAQNATGNFVKITQRLPVRILFDHPPAQYALRPGLSVEASVRTAGGDLKNGGCSPKQVRERNLR